MQLMDVANLIVFALAAWFGVGIIVALLFVTLGVSKVDVAARGASPLFRPAIFLGCVVLWPIIALRWLSGVKINEPNDGAS